MVVCYGSAVRPINQAASWLPEVMHVKGPAVSPQKTASSQPRTQGAFSLQRSLVFSTRFRWFSPSFSTPTCCCTCCTCQRKLGVRLTLVLPPSRMPLASASAAVALIARELDGGSLSGSLGFCAPSRLRCLGGGSPGSPTGSPGLCARCPALALLSEGLPAGPHGHCVSLASSCSCSSGVSAVGSTSLSSSPPPSPVVSLPESWLLFSHSPARSLLLSPSLLRACLYGVGLLLELLPVLACGRCWLSYTLCFILFFLLSSADFPAKFPGLLEHLPHFVRVCTT